MLEKSSGNPIQGCVLGRGDATSPYTVQSSDEIVEFGAAGSVVTALNVGADTTTTVLKGSRYSISGNVKTITFVGKFNVS